MKPLTACAVAAMAMTLLADTAATFEHFVRRVEPRLLPFGLHRPQQLRQPLLRPVCAACPRPRIARELRAYSIHSLHSDLF